MKKIVLICTLFVALLLSACSSSHSENSTCPSCGTENPDGAKYCCECSLSLDEISADNGEGAQTETETESEYGGSASCYECADNGLDECQGHKCLACNGVGYDECPICQNSSYGCYICNGNGNVDCLSCDNGVIYYGNTGNPIAFPAEEDCPECDSGYVTCTVCNGTGRYGSYSVGGIDGGKSTEVDKLCYKCNGGKKVSCARCYGRGTLLP